MESLRESEYIVIMLFGAGSMTSIVVVNFFSIQSL